MPTYGAYKSVNKLPHFADLIAEHGPFDPSVRVGIRMTRDGRYTIEGDDAFDENGKAKYKLDLAKFINNTLNGVYCLSNGLLRIDALGERWYVYISEVGPGISLPYSINAVYKGVDIQYLTDALILPSDHPFLQAFKSV